PRVVVARHMVTSWSFDCTVAPTELVEHAEAEGLGAIAVTDHNVFGGALEAAAYARERDGYLIVIPGEEIKTDSQGEVIGLFLEREIPRGMPFADTIAAIREQSGIVYVPHPSARSPRIPNPPRPARLPPATTAGQHQMILLQQLRQNFRLTPPETNFPFGFKNLPN
ncbi:MAG: PHP domain-containing protein, partial [Planctomycetota bacterium]